MDNNLEPFMEEIPYPDDPLGVKPAAYAMPRGAAADDDRHINKQAKREKLITAWNTKSRALQKGFSSILGVLNSMFNPTC